MNGQENLFQSRVAHRAPRVITAGATTATLDVEDYNFFYTIPATTLVITLPPTGHDKAINRKYVGVCIADSGGTAKLVDAEAVFTSANATGVGDVLDAENILGKSWE